MKNITLGEVFDLEIDKKIIIYNPNTVKSHLSQVKEWVNNWEKFKIEHYQIPLSKIFQLFDYRIESEDPRTKTWTYMYGKI